MLNRFLASRWRIIVQGTFIVAAPLLGLALFVYVNVTSELESLSIGKRQSIAYTAAHLLDEKLRGEIAFGNAFTSRYLLVDAIKKGDAVEMERHLKTLVQTSSTVERAFIASPKAILLADYPVLANVRGTDFSERDWYKGVSRAWTPHISEYFMRAAMPRKYVFHITIPIRSHTGEVIGILGMAPKTDFAKQRLESVTKSGGITYLVDSKGTIIYHPDLPQDRPLNIAQSAIIQKVMKGQNGYEKGVDPLKGQTVISAYHPVDICGWGVITEQLQDQVLAPVKQIARGIYFFTTIMLLIGGYLAWRRSELIFTLQKTTAELQQSSE